MTGFQFSFLGCLMGLMLFVASLIGLYMWGVRIWKHVLFAFLKMAGALCLIAGLLKLASWADNLLVSLLIAGVLNGVAAMTVVRKSRIGQASFILPVFGGQLVSLVVLGLFFLCVVCGVSAPFRPQMFLPMMGILLGVMVTPNAKALAAYYDGVRHHAQRYHFLVGNGATHHEAVAYFHRQALQCAAAAWVQRMALTSFLSLPVVMCVLLLYGVPEIEAALWCLFLAGVMICLPMCSVFLTLFLARKYVFDIYGQIKWEGESH